MKPFYGIVGLLLLTSLKFVFFAQRLKLVSFLENLGNFLSGFPSFFSFLRAFKAFIWVAIINLSKFVIFLCEGRNFSSRCTLCSYSIYFWGWGFLLNFGENLCHFF
ncbi:hypothetical protein SLEP1_g3557 [Rubroshorea leprosula]|uniref:Uncharacterized protein n=1 Tax=Rubroshorea leprosula TaxID=152421 RepID=A0AAV5HU21_9ROSI|nr:hypothetical protein SLEP1_g3557 [Rubroshorea leprosula]